MTLFHTPFHDKHLAAGARMVDFGGWHMPVQYSGIIQEHQATRTAVGLFDVSHMGELRVTGPNALPALEQLVSNRVSDIQVGHSQYAALMNHSGGIVDDLFIYRLADQDYLVCINAGNRDKDWRWFQEHNPHGAELRNESDVWAQLALQGPRAAELAAALSRPELAQAGRGTITPATFAGVEGCLMARTGYTGEDGFEVFLPAQTAPAAWDRVVEEGAGYGLSPVGLGARDTLRLEARNVLYGNDITDDTSPLEAGLGWITKLDKPDFNGRDALVKQKAEGLPRRLVGLVVEKRIPRPHCAILNADGEVVGEVTSGTRSPSLKSNIALGYVKAERGNARPGNTLTIDVRGRQAAAKVVKGPFYRSDR